MYDKKMSPVLKWAGGKIQLLEHIANRMPSEYNNYYEPFIGGGAVLLGMSPTQAFINDVNEQLVNLYTQLKIVADNVIAKVNEMDAASCSKELYYATREQYNAKIACRDFDAECAALMIWINKHCFNELYRVNSKGLFNVPYNNKGELLQHIAPIVRLDDTDELAKRFDNFMYGLMLASMEQMPAFKPAKKTALRYCYLVGEQGKHSAGERETADYQGN